MKRLYPLFLNNLPLSGRRNPPLVAQNQVFFYSAVDKLVFSKIEKTKGMKKNFAQFKNALHFCAKKWYHAEKEKRSQTEGPATNSK